MVTLNIQAKTSLNGVKKSGGDQFNIVYNGPEDSGRTSEQKWIDNQNGSYTITFKLYKTGVHMIGIKHNGMHISSSPVVIDINGMNKRHCY